MEMAKFKSFYFFTFALTLESKPNFLSWGPTLLAAPLLPFPVTLLHFM